MRDDPVIPCTDDELLRRLAAWDDAKTRLEHARLVEEEARIEMVAALHSRGIKGLAL
jgi:hypothetical protein